MTITVGDQVPSTTVFQMQSGENKAIDTDSLMATGKVLVFALPGAYTPTCSAAHLPGYVIHADALHEAGVDRIICLSVNDAFVMDAWGKDHNAEDKVLMIGDGNASFTRAIGLDVDRSASGMGLRSQRYAMLINEGVVEFLAVEEPGQFEVSGAESLLTKISNTQAA